MEPIFVNWHPEGSQMLCVGRTRMAELIASGEIESVKLGRKRLIPVRALHEFAERLARSNAAA